MSAEVIQLIERRRSWPTELKLKILLEALRPGTTIAATADRHGVARGLVYTWMRAAREGRLPGLSLNDRPLNDRPLNDRPLNDRPHNDGPHNDGPHNDGPHNDGPHDDGPHDDGQRNDGAPAFVPVRVDAEPPAPGPMTPADAAQACLLRQPMQLQIRTRPQRSPPPPRRPLLLPDRVPVRPGYVEVKLGNGRIVKVDEAIDATTLARLVAALDAPAPERPSHDEPGIGEAP